MIRPTGIGFKRELGNCNFVWTWLKTTQSPPWWHWYFANFFRSGAKWSSRTNTKTSPKECKQVVSLLPNLLIWFLPSFKSLPLSFVLPRHIFSSVPFCSRHTSAVFCWCCMRFLQICSIAISTAWSPSSVVFLSQISLTNCTLCCAGERRDKDSLAHQIYFCFSTLSVLLRLHSHTPTPDVVICGFYPRSLPGNGCETSDMFVLSFFCANIIIKSSFVA